MIMIASTVTHPSTNTLITISNSIPLTSPALRGITKMEATTMGITSRPPTLFLKNLPRLRPPPSWLRPNPHQSLRAPRHNRGLLKRTLHTTLREETRPLTSTFTRLLTTPTVRSRCSRCSRATKEVEMLPQTSMLTRTSLIITLTTITITTSIIIVIMEIMSTIRVGIKSQVEGYL